MTKLAIQYQISRTFFYQLMRLALMSLTEMYHYESREIKSHQMDIEPLIVILRLEVKCSTSSISDLFSQISTSIGEQNGK